jgi:hypothetical protein
VSCADLLDAALAGGTRTIVVVGTAKNVGKTVTFNALRAFALRRGIVGAITSIGRDGEPADALDGARKPRVRVQPGTLLALPRDLVPRAPALEIIDTGHASALGPIVFARAHYAADCEIGGPPTASGVRATIDRLGELTPEPTFVDGAIDRIAPLAGGAGDAIVLATGAASGASSAAVAELVRSTIARLTIPAVDPDEPGTAQLAIPGALDARDAHELLTGSAGHRPTVVVADPTRIAIRGKLLDRFLAAFDLRCRRPLRVVACTTCSIGAGRTLDPRELVAAVAAATGLPVFDVVAGLPR